MLEARRNLALEDPILRETETSGGLNMGWNRANESKPPNGNRGNHVTSVDGNTLAHAESLRAHVLDAVVWVTKSQIAQKLHGIVGVIFRDPVHESSQHYNEIA